MQSLLGYDDIDVNFVWKKTGATALIVAVQKGHEKGVQLLLNHKDIDVNFAWEQKSGQTPLMLVAGQYGNVVILKHLLAHPSIEINKTDKNGQSALWYANHFGHEGIAELLVTASCDTATELHVQKGE